MSKSVKFINDTYLDSSSVVNNQVPLSEILTPVVLFSNPNGETDSITLTLSYYYRATIYNKVVNEQSTNKELKITKVLGYK